ncbi:MAG: helix-turn-helix transcriptional regulator [Candidatus Magasanikbacteria bacterium]
MKSYSKIKQKLLRDKTIRVEYNKLHTEFALAKMIIQKRLTKGFTQATLAQRIGTKQSAIARLESGSYNPSLIFMTKIAKALDAKLTVSLS